MRSVVALLFVAACGGGGSDPPPVVDAPPEPALGEVSCGNEVETIDSLSNRFEPASVTISVGDVVAFDTGAISEEHDIVPNSPNAEGLDVNGGQLKCFQFDEPGTYGFRCFNHGFVGMVIVQ
jgi:plastocyanin